MDIEKLEALVDRESTAMSAALAAGHKMAFARHRGALEAYSSMLTAERAERSDPANRWKHCEWHPPVRHAGT